jgi:hypothetical protein
MRISIPTPIARHILGKFFGHSTSKRKAAPFLSRAAYGEII